MSVAVELFLTWN